LDTWVLDDLGAEPHEIHSGIARSGGTYPQHILPVDRKALKSSRSPVAASAAIDSVKLMPTHLLFFPYLPLGVRTKVNAWTLIPSRDLKLQDCTGNLALQCAQGLITL
jgi:hypothetical protein